jgi:mRNA interferase MazF
VVTLAPAALALVPFPFSDLSGSKLRPAVVLAAAGHNDWLPCQTSRNLYVLIRALRQH